jgi:hypothetical protein
MKRLLPASALAVLVGTLSGCTGIINNTPDLRWFLFSHFGANKICPEMITRSVPIHLADRAPSVGRFFPNTCSVTVDNARHVIVVAVGGTGYGYVTPAKRVGFSVSASVEYRPDFVISGDDTYLWARVNRVVDGPHFQTGYMENPIMDVMGNLPPFGNLANFLGNQAVSGAMTQGFTVIHNGNGDDFTIGIINPPQRPQHPFQIAASDRLTFANETTDVQANERDFLGPFEVAKPGQAIFFSTTVQGPPVNLVVVSKAVGDAWREAYQTGRPSVSPPGPVLYTNTVRPGAVDTQRFNVAPGLYYVVIDNTGAQAPGAGILPSLMTPLSPLGLGGGGGALARVNYVAQLSN